MANNTIASATGAAVANSNKVNQKGLPGCEATPADEGFVSFLATVYEHLVKLTPPCKGQITRFHAIKPPDISIKDYLDRIQRYFGCSNECFVLSLVYIDRIVKMHDDFSVSILNVHRLVITSIVLAAKFFDDVYYSNAFYARVGGVRTREINILEAHFLSLLDFHLFVSPQEYDQYRQNVLAAVSHPHLHQPVRSIPSTPSGNNNDPASHMPQQQQQSDIQTDTHGRQPSANNAPINAPFHNAMGHQVTSLSNAIVWSSSQKPEQQQQQQLMNFMGNNSGPNAGGNGHDTSCNAQDFVPHAAAPTATSTFYPQHNQAALSGRKSRPVGAVFAPTQQLQNDKHDISFSVPIDHLTSVAATGNAGSSHRIHQPDPSLVVVTW